MAGRDNPWRVLELQNIGPQARDRFVERHQTLYQGGQAAAVRAARQRVEELPPEVRDNLMIPPWPQVQIFKLIQDEPLASTWIKFSEYNVRLWLLGMDPHEILWGTPEAGAAAGHFPTLDAVAAAWPADLRDALERAITLAAGVPPKERPPKVVLDAIDAFWHRLNAHKGAAFPLLPSSSVALLPGPVAAPDGHTPAAVREAAKRLAQWSPEARENASRLQGLAQHTASWSEAEIVALETIAPLAQSLTDWTPDMIAALGRFLAVITAAPADPRPPAEVAHAELDLWIAMQLGRAAARTPAPSARATLTRATSSRTPKPKTQRNGTHSSSDDAE